MFPIVVRVDRCHIILRSPEAGWGSYIRFLPSFEGVLYGAEYGWPALVQASGGLCGTFDNCQLVGTGEVPDPEGLAA